MKKVLPILLIFLFAGCGIKYQRNHSEYTEQEITDRAKVYFGYDFDFQNKGNEYIVDGRKISVDSLKIFLTHNKEKDYRKIYFEKKDCENKNTDMNCGIVLNIETKLTEQSESEKIKILERTKNNLNKYVSKIVIRPDICNECKLILVNYKPYQNREAKKIINEIQLSDIESIIEYKQPLNPVYFGSMAKAGWVQIWTK
jgi:hypothetical protein